MEILKVLPFLLYVSYLFIKNKLNTENLKDSIIYFGPVIYGDVILCLIYLFVCIALLNNRSFYDILIKMIPLVPAPFFIVFMFRSYEFRKSLPLPFLTTLAASTYASHQSFSYLNLVIVTICLIYDTFIISQKDGPKEGPKS